MDKNGLEKPNRGYEGEAFERLLNDMIETRDSVSQFRKHDLPSLSADQRQSCLVVLENIRFEIENAIKESKD